MNNKGVSAVIGIILMTTLTVAIAATVFYYVNVISDSDKTFSTIEGNCTTFEYSNDVYTVTFDSGETIKFFDGQGINWQIGNYYNLSIWTREYFRAWYIDEYIVVG